MSSRFTHLKEDAEAEVDSVLVKITDINGVSHVARCPAPLHSMKNTRKRSVSQFETVSPKHLKRSARHRTSESCGDPVAGAGAGAYHALEEESAKDSVSVAVAACESQNTARLYPPLPKRKKPLKELTAEEEHHRRTRSHGIAVAETVGAFFYHVVLGPTRWSLSRAQAIQKFRDTHGNGKKITSRETVAAARNAILQADAKERAWHAKHDAAIADKMQKP